MNVNGVTRRWLPLSLPLVCLLLGGCGESIPPEILAARQRLLLDKEPQGAISIEDARKLVADDPLVTLIVKVGNRNFENWSEQNQARFFVSEGFPGSDYNIGPDHDPSTCPFCKWKWKEEDSLAVVQVVDESGNMLSVSADSVLDLNDGDVITIEGKASADDSGFLNVQLSSLYLHP